LAITTPYSHPPASFCVFSIRQSSNRVESEQQLLEIEYSESPKEKLSAEIPRKASDHLQISLIQTEKDQASYDVVPTLCIPNVAHMQNYKTFCPFRPKAVLKNQIAICPRVKIGVRTLKANA